MPLELEIPEEFYEPKAFYRTRESADAVVNEIKDHIQKTGLPHSWRHHTHSPPVSGARIVYLGKFNLPASHKGQDRHAPCPVCSPRAPKYFWNGMIAWFPDEHVIRMIGPECFATLNPEGHWEAVEQFEAEEAERKTIAYLVNNTHLSADACKIAAAAVPTLECVDSVHKTLQSRLTDVAHVNVWKHVSRGVLTVNVTSRRMRRHRDGSESFEDFLDIRELSQFAGHRMFSPRTSNLASRMKACIKRLSLVDFGDEKHERIRAMTQDERAKAARILSKGLEAANNIFEEAEEIRRGFSPMAIATLKGWTRHAGCPVHLYVNGDAHNFYIGLDEAQQMRVELPHVFWTHFGTLPKIGPINKNIQGE